MIHLLSNEEPIERIKFEYPFFEPIYIIHNSLFPISFRNSRIITLIYLYI